MLSLKWQLYAQSVRTSWLKFLHFSLEFAYEKFVICSTVRPWLDIFSSTPCINNMISLIFFLLHLVISVYNLSWNCWNVEIIELTKNDYLSSYQIPRPNSPTVFLNISGFGILVSNHKQSTLLTCIVGFRLNLTIKPITVLFFCIHCWSINLGNCHIKGLSTKSN